MNRRIGRPVAPLIFMAALGTALPSPGQDRAVLIRDRPPDPHGSPRPARDARDVPIGSSLYFELGMPPGAGTDAVDPASVAVSIRAEGGEPVVLLGPGRRFEGGASGWLRPTNDLQGVASLAVYVEPNATLRASTTYRVAVSARSHAGIELPATGGSWTFATETSPGVRSLTFPLDLRSNPVRWRGGFFTGFGNISFCTSAASFGPTYDLMAEARKGHPKAWAYQRDFWMTGTAHRPEGLVAHRPPNVVRERETRRIVAIERDERGVSLRLEDVFGIEQYGVPLGRPLGDDYHPGEEVFVADGVHDARARVISVDDTAKTVRLTPIVDPPGGWKIAYEGPLPTAEDPDAPGLFAPGGCYLRKLKPHGTPCYYWGRLDKEWDLAHRQYGRRLLPNFADAPGDLSRDGRAWTTAKDLSEYHDVARAIAGHVIDRYGADALTFTWSVFNEPDLGPLFWRADDEELRRFYDYSVDAILRAFEDRGFDSSRVFIGGLELGGIFGTNLVKLREFLAHCSGRDATVNAAVADPRLDGRRSRRVEALGRSHGGKGSPCDFVSIHAYNRSDLMAAKLIRAKEIALEVDADFFRDLAVNSHESCPDWMPPPDEAASDSYLGNGYFPTWCLDVARRQLGKAAGDPRFASGESILTVWPPNRDFSGLNAVTRTLRGEDGRDVTIPMPIFHALGLLADLGDRYWVLPDRTVGGHVVAGFASRADDGTVRVALYSHQAQDTQSRSTLEFDIALEVEGMTGPGVAVREFRFDKDHNSYFRPARELRGHAEGRDADPARLNPPSKALESADPEARRAALRALGALGPSARSALPAILRLMGQDQDEGVKSEARAAVDRIFAPPSYPQAVIDRFRQLAECRATATSAHPVGADGRLRLKARVAGNGVNFLVIAPRP